MMIVKGRRREGQPILLQGNSIHKLDRISLSSKTYDEGWVQKLIQDYPEILPVEEIEGNFAPLIPIGREVGTNVGAIDNLFISPEGYLIIVETKLWRNPEARREVVAQILDYAKEVSKWSFSVLDDLVKEYNYRYNNCNDGLINTLKKKDQFDEEDESYFIDRVNNHLENGKFLLLIVGDGISESVEEMVEYLSSNPNLLFSLSLIELKVYKLDETKNTMLVIPQVVTRTREIIRSVIRLESNKTESPKIIFENEIRLQAKSNSKRYTISEMDYFEKLQHYTKDKSLVELAKQIMNDCESLGCIIDWKQGSFVVKLKDPNGSNRLMTLFVVEKRGNIKVGWLQDQLKKNGFSPELSYIFAANTAKLFENIKVNHQYKGSWEKKPTLAELKPVYEKFLEQVNHLVVEIKKAQNSY